MTHMPTPEEYLASVLAVCTPEMPKRENFNSKAEIPYGVTTEHVHKAMVEFVEFLGFIDTQLVREKKLQRFEEMLMPANFSSIVGEFMTATIPKHCPTVVKNAYHNGHPDIIPTGKFKDNSVQHGGAVGIEVKASRYLKSWQGHNEEDVWLMVFMFESGRPTDVSKGVKPSKFRFVSVFGAELKAADWKLAGRKEGSRRTITASVTPAGYLKMAKNWIYKAPGLDLESQATLIGLEGDEG